MDIKEVYGHLDDRNYIRKYADGCTKFKNYNSIDEYMDDVIICIMACYPHYNYPQASETAYRFLENVENSYEIKENAYDCGVDLGYCCG